MITFIRFTTVDDRIEEAVVNMAAEDVSRLVMAGVDVITADGRIVPAKYVIRVYDVYDVVAITVVQIWRDLPPELGDNEVTHFHRLLAAIAEEAGREWFASDGKAVHVPRNEAS